MQRLLARDPAIARDAAKESHPGRPRESVLLQDEHLANQLRIVDEIDASRACPERRERAVAGRSRLQKSESSGRTSGPRTCAGRRLLMGRWNCRPGWHAREIFLYGCSFLAATSDSRLTLTRASTSRKSNERLPLASECPEDSKQELPTKPCAASAAARSYGTSMEYNDD